MITEPNLNCQHCYELYNGRAKVKPLCKTERGCHIEDIAADIEVNEFCAKFTRAKSVGLASGLTNSQERIFRELGLFENEDLWIELEAIHAEWIHEERKKQQHKKDGWNKVL